MSLAILSQLPRLPDSIQHLDSLKILFIRLKHFETIFTL